MNPLILQVTLNININLFNLNIFVLMIYLLIQKHFLVDSVLLNNEFGRSHTSQPIFVLQSNYLYYY